MALFANVSLAEESLAPALKHLLNSRQMKAAKLNGVDATGSLARLLKRGKSPLQSVGLSSGRRPDALRQVVARQLDAHGPVCNQTTYSDDACGNEIEMDQIPIQCTQVPDVEFLSFKTGIVDEQLYFFSFVGADCTGVGAGLGLGKDWQNNCVYFPDGDEYYRVSCEEEPPTLASKNLGTCNIRQYGNSQCSGSHSSTTVPSGCTKIEDDEVIVYVRVQEIDGSIALVAYEKEGCTGVSAAVMLGEAGSLSKCAPFGAEDEYIQIRCDEPNSATPTLLMSSALYYLAFGMIWLFNCVV